MVHKPKKQKQTHKADDGNLKLANISTSKSDQNEGEQDFISLHIDQPAKSWQDSGHSRENKLKRRRPLSSESSDEETIDKEATDLLNDIDNDERLKSFYPWMDDSLQSSYSDSENLSIPSLLETEVESFIKYLEPTRAEIRMREYLIHKVLAAVQRRWPEAELDIFGSYSTNLFLPNSDIDMVLYLPRSSQSKLYDLADILTNANICSRPQVIGRATVPVVKFEDSLTSLKVDVVINEENGIQGARIIREMMSKQPGLRPLTMIVKHYLALRNLNEVFMGGMGGYAIVCMVLSFLQMHPKVAAGLIDPEKNFGVLLLDFLQLYGSHFNMNKVGIRVKKNGSYFKKPKIRYNRYDRIERPVYAIEDPNNPSNDIGAKSFKARSVSKAFEFAYLAITRKAFVMAQELENNNDKGLDKGRLNYPRRLSLLSTFLLIPKDMQRKRDIIKDVYENKKYLHEQVSKSFKWKSYEL